MEKEVDKLKMEILVLKERINILEKKEHRRGILKSVRLFCFLVLYLLFGKDMIILLIIYLIIWKKR